MGAIRFRFPLVTPALRARMQSRQLHLFGSKRQRGTVVRAGEPSEFQLSCSVADLFRRWLKPTWLWTHFPAGEERPTAAGERLKRMGLKRGWPDYILISPRDGERPALPHFIELKRRRGGRLSDDQAAFHLACMTNGIAYAVVRDVADVIEIGNQWSVWRGVVTAQ